MPEKNINTDDDMKERPINWQTRGHTLWQGSFVHRGITYTIKFIGGRGGRWDIVFEQRVPVGGIIKIVAILGSILSEFILSTNPAAINVRKINNKKLRKIVVSLIRKFAKKKPPKDKPMPVEKDKSISKEKEVGRKPSPKKDDKSKSGGWTATKTGQRKVYK